VKELPPLLLFPVQLALRYRFQTLLRMALQLPSALQLPTALRYRFQTLLRMALQLPKVLR
jgi:hypothetical protein